MCGREGAGVKEERRNWGSPKLNTVRIILHFPSDILGPCFISSSPAHIRTHAHTPHTRTHPYTHPHTIKARPMQVVIQRRTFQPTSLAVDWIGWKLYWTDTMNQRLKVANLDGSSARILLSASLHPRGWP